MKISTADLYDAHEGNVQVATPLFKPYGMKKQFYGIIQTIQCFEDNSFVGDTLRNENGKGKVLVIDGGGSLRCALVGDLIAAAALKNEWEGILVYGCIRDSVEINQMGIGIKALNTNPKKSVKKNIGTKNEPVHFADVDFVPGKFIYADEDGILISEKPLF